MLGQFTQQVLRGEVLSDEQVLAAVEELTREELAPETKAEFLSGLARRGETVAEIAAFARALRDKAIVPPLDPETRSRTILDVCGTGGDCQNTFNISTTVALVLAAAGVTVAKHGNRAITSRSGSADVLEALGIPIDQAPEAAARSLRDHQFAFFFAPRYHPAFKGIGPARKLCAERRQRTIFNYLGPLLNPARPSAQLIGVPQPGLCEPMVRVLQMLGVRRGMVVSGRAGEACLDELSILGENTIAEFYQDRALSVSVVEFAMLPLQPARISDLAGADARTNADIVRRILGGEEKGPKRDAVLLNVAAALLVAGQVRSIADGWEQAAAVIDSGRARAKMEVLARAPA